MILHLDPSYGIPEPLARTYAAALVKVEFQRESAGKRCGRCNRDLTGHWWQVLNPDNDEQGGIEYCEMAPS